jgi:L-seryl-tRNA(Ser) seleniumtransferase
MLSATQKVMSRRANSLSRKIKKKLAGKCTVSIKETGSRVGGGALPAEDLKSTAVVLEPLDRTVNELEHQLRTNACPVIGRIEEDRFMLDMRTVGDDEIPLLETIFHQVFGVKA